MIAKIEKMKESGKISKKSIYYGFKAKKGWTSFVNDHHRTMESIYQGFISRFANDPTNNMTISRFSDYSKHFLSFLSIFSKFPLTRLIFNFAEQQILEYRVLCSKYRIQSTMTIRRNMKTIFWTNISFKCRI